MHDVINSFEFGPRSSIILGSFLMRKKLYPVCGISGKKRLQNELEKETWSKFKHNTDLKRQSFYTAPF